MESICFHSDELFDKQVMYFIIRLYHWPTSSGKNLFVEICQFFPVVTHPGSPVGYPLFHSHQRLFSSRIFFSTVFQSFPVFSLISTVTLLNSQCARTPLNALLEKNTSFSSNFFVIISLFNKIKQFSGRLKFYS